MRLGTFALLLRRLTLAATLVGLLAAPAVAEVTTESQLKAAYLINFLKYIDWPESGEPINLCLFGRNNLTPHLAAHEGRLIGGRELHIRKVHRAEQIADCQELFIPEAEANHFASLIHEANKLAILTISDAAHFPQAGGAIAIVRTAGHLRFDINVDALAQASLRASPLLISLARQVTGTPR